MPVLHQIPNFHAGLISNAAWSRYKNDAANKWENLRVHPQGYLEPRNGNVLASDNLDIGPIFVYKNIMLTVTFGRLKWARLGARDDNIDFYDFEPDVFFDEDADVTFKAPPENSEDEYIFVGNGKDLDDTRVVGLEGVFGEDQADPTCHRFYYGPRTTLSVTLAEEGELEDGEVGTWNRYTGALSDFPADAIAIHPDENTILATLDDFSGQDIESLTNKRFIVDGTYIIFDVIDVRRRTFNNRDLYSMRYSVFTGPLEQTTDLPSSVTLKKFDIETVENRIYLRLQSVIAKDGDHFVNPTVTSEPTIEIVQVNITPTTKITVIPGGIAAEGTHTDLYRSARESIPVEEERAPDDKKRTYYRVRRIQGAGSFSYYPGRYEEDQELDYDLTLEPDVGRPTWKYIESDSIRSYAIEENGTDLFISYFDGISDRRVRNFSDKIPLNTGGEVVTGLKFLRENQLAVYTPSRIILIQTDPLAELIRVVSVFTTDDRDAPMGCIAPKSIVAIGGYHYFLSVNKRVMRFGGRKPGWVSSKVQPELDLMEIDYPSDGSIALANAHAVEYNGMYHLSFPSMQATKNVLAWRSHELTWHGNTLQFRPNEAQTTPNRTLIFDVDRDRWYQDGFGVLSYTKGANERLYGVLTGDEFTELYALYEDTDDSESFDYLWESNIYDLPARTVIHNVYVRLSGAGTVQVTVTTEQGTQTRTINVTSPFAYYSQRAGFNLKGETAIVGIQSSSKVRVNRIAINETF